MKIYDTVLQNTRVPLTHRRERTFAGRACVTCAGVTRNRYFISGCACYVCRGRRCGHSKIMIKFLMGCNSNKLYIMRLSDKNARASVAFCFCCRPADCHRAAGNHEYVKELSKQVFSKQQRIQVDQKLVAAQQQEFRTVS